MTNPHNSAKFLAAALFGGGCVALAGVAYLYGSLGGVSIAVPEDLRRLALPVQMTFGCASAWLVTMALSSWLRGRQWHRGGPTRNSTWNVVQLENLALVGVLVFVLSRGASSCALLLGLAEPVAVVSVAAALMVFLGVADYRLSRRWSAATSPAMASQRATWPWALHAVLTTLLAAALVGLEWQRPEEKSRMAPSITPVAELVRVPTSLARARKSHDFRYGF